MFAISDQILLEGDRVVSLRIHEMVTVVVFVTELKLLPLDIDHLDLVSGPKPDVRAFAGIDVTDDRLDKRPQVSGCAMMDFQHNGGVAVVLYGHSFSEIVSCG